MKLPELKEGMVIKCLTSDVDWWTVDKEYPVTYHEGHLAIFDDERDNYGKGECLSMTFEVIEPPWSGKGYPPVGIDCMVHRGDDTPIKARIDYVGKEYCCYTCSYEHLSDATKDMERVDLLADLIFTPIKTNRQEVIDSIVGDDFTSKALATDLVDEIIAGKHKWLEFTGGE